MTEFNGRFLNGENSTPDMRHERLGSMGQDGDYSADLNSLRAKFRELEARMSQMRPSQSMDDFRQQDHQHDDYYGGMETLPEKPRSARTPAKPELRRVSWVSFKNRYLDEEVYAIDVLMGQPKFYWQRRTEEREMKDRIEAATNYNSNGDLKDEMKPVKLPLDKPEALKVAQKEMPERIRINSAPILAILAEIAGEKWSSEPKVFLRPYKLLVVYAKEIRLRLEVLKKIWASRPKPDDVTTSAEDVDIQDTESTGGDLHDQDSAFGDSLMRMTMRSRLSTDALSELVNGRETRRVDLTTTYEALQDLEVLVQFMDEDVSPIVKLHAPGTNHPKIYFRDLWHLYKPGDEVILDKRNAKRFTTDASLENGQAPGQHSKLGERHLSVWKVLRVGEGRPKLCPQSKQEMNRQPSNKIIPFCVRCYRIDYDGDQFGPIWIDFHFHAWEGQKSIEQLDVVPLRMTKGAQERRESCIQRGKEFMKFTSPQHRHYNGPILSHHPSGMLFEHVSPGQRDVYGPVIVDFKEAARADPRMVMTLGFTDDKLWDEDIPYSEAYPMYIWRDRKARDFTEKFEEIYEDEHLDEHLMHKHIAGDMFLSSWENLMRGDFIDGATFGDNEFLLMPNRVCAFLLQRRKFALLRLDRMKALQPDSRNWDDLFLARDNKETVKAQTMHHFRNKRNRGEFESVGQFDLNREKGLGLIILLHGVPGVGKSSTAECVAELLGKPLFPITCGDLGTTAEQVELQLYSIFTKAEKWDCVLLLDEADVFLASRGKNDLKRNAVVSVFLRILEFYTGILFLTTNRTGVLDEAFMSRIHTQLYYPSLNEQQTLKIWETNLRKLALRKGASMTVNKEQIMDFARWHFSVNAGKSTVWNGRQIRNACMTAAALAEHETLGALNQNGLKTPAAGEIAQPSRLEVAHFEKVDIAVREFHDYMTDVCGDDFAGVAKMRGERYDDYRPQPQQDQYAPRSPAQPPQQRPDLYSIRERQGSYPSQGSGYSGPSPGSSYGGYTPQSQYSSQRFVPPTYTRTQSEIQFARPQYAP